MGRHHLDTYTPESAFPWRAWRELVDLSRQAWRDRLDHNLGDSVPDGDLEMVVALIDKQYCNFARVIGVDNPSAYTK